MRNIFAFTIIALGAIGCSVAPPADGSATPASSTEIPDIASGDAAVADLRPVLSLEETPHAFWDAWSTAESFEDLLPFVTGKFEETLRLEMRSNRGQGWFTRSREVYTGREIESVETTWEKPDSAQSIATLSPIYDADSGEMFNTRVTQNVSNIDSGWRIEIETFTTLRRAMGKEEMRGRHKTSWGEWAPKWERSNRQNMAPNHLDLEGEPLFVYADPVLEATLVRYEGAEQIDVTAAAILYNPETSVLFVTMATENDPLAHAFHVDDIDIGPGLYAKRYAREIFIVHRFDGESVELEHRKFSREMELDLTTLSFEEASELGAFSCSLKSEYIYHGTRSPVNQ